MALTCDCRLETESFFGAREDFKGRFPSTLCEMMAWLRVVRTMSPVPTSKIPFYTEKTCELAKAPSVGSSSLPLDVGKTP